MQCEACGTLFDDKSELTLDMQFKNTTFTICGTCLYQELHAVGVNLSMASQIERGLKTIRSLLEFDENIEFKLVKNIREKYETSSQEEVSRSTTPLKTPKEIKSFLDEYVVGQEDAKIALSLAVHRLQLMEKNPHIKKTNIFLIGPTASGKTELGRTIGKLLNRPFLNVDTSSLTPGGYVGKNVQTILKDLITISGGDLELAENGVIFLDELDKVAKRKSELCIQSELLKIIEDGEYPIEMGHKGSGEVVTLSTKNILFIGAGAFHGLYSHELKKNIGLNSKVSHLSGNQDKTIINNNDLITFGLKKEFLGRFDTVVCLDKIDKDTVKKIITEPKNSILKEYESIFKEMGLQLKLSSSDLEEIANEVYHGETGLRGLRSVFSRKFSPYIFQGQSYVGIDDNETQEMTA